MPRVNRSLVTSGANAGVFAVARTRWSTIALLAVASLVTSLLMLTAPSAADAATLAETEPNDTMATADPIALGDTLTGSILSTGTYDTDYYALDVPAAGRATFDFRFPSGLGTDRFYRFQVYDQSGALRYDFSLGGGDYAGSSLRGMSTFVPAGRLYIRVSGYKGYAEWGQTYSLAVTVSAGTVETEVNDDTATADTLALGATVRGSILNAGTYDTDYYAVDVPKAGRATFDFRFPSGLGADRFYRFQVYDQSGGLLYDSSVGGGDYSGAALRAMSTFVPAGRLYVRVSGYSGYAEWGKTYSLAVTVAAGTVETEFNDGTASADALALGTTIQGSILNAGSYDTDYFAVNSPLAARATFDLRFPAGLGTDSFYRFQVYDQNGGTLYDFSLDGSDYDGSWLRAQATSLPKGAAYVRVSGYSGYAEWGKAYSLKVTLVPTTATPVVSGTLAVGSTLTANPGAWTSGTTFSYQWFASGVAITGATAATVKLSSAQAGKQVVVKVTGRKPGYTTVTKSSVATLKVATVGTPTIAGTVKVGSVLTARPGTWTPGTGFSYRWYADGVQIAGASASTFTLTSTQRGKAITVRVAGALSGYATIAKYSAATIKVL